MVSKGKMFEPLMMQILMKMKTI